MSVTDNLVCASPAAIESPRAPISLYGLVYTVLASTATHQSLHDILLCSAALGTFQLISDEFSCGSYRLRTPLPFPMS